MKPESFMDAANRYVDQTCRTTSSKTSTLSTLRQLHALHPRYEPKDFVDIMLTHFCLASDPSPNTVKARRVRLMGFFAWCKWQGLIDSNPASELRFTAKHGKGGGVRQHTWLGIADFKDLLYALPTTTEGERARIVLLLGGTLGLRRTEIADLRTSDFDDRCTTVTFVGKGSKLATLGVPAETRIVLGDWMAGQPDGQETLLPALVYDTPPGPFQAGCDWLRPITQGTVASIVGWAGKQAGIHLECHDLRRSYAGMLEEMGYTIEQISRLMRHDNISTTSRYMESNPARLSDLAAKFSLS